MMKMKNVKNFFKWILIYIIPMHIVVFIGSFLVYLIMKDEPFPLYNVFIAPILTILVSFFTVVFKNRKDKVDTNTLVMIYSMITNIALAILKVVVGILSFSSALVADGFHSFSDLITDIIAIVGGLMSRKPADKEHPYGHGKMEYLISLFIGIIIIVIGSGVVFTSVKKDYIIPNSIVIIVSAITIIVKTLLSRYIIKKGKETESSILIASGKESRMDAVSSVVVLIASILMQFSGEFTILKYSDVIAAVIVGICIIKVGIDVIRENISTILGEQVLDKEYINKIKETILMHDDIIKIDELILLKYGPYYRLNLELCMKKDMHLDKVDKLVHHIEKDLRKLDKRLYYVMIHVNPVKE